jgi:hypothetical protein
VIHPPDPLEPMHARKGEDLNGGKKRHAPLHTAIDYMAATRSVYKKLLDFGLSLTILF